MVSQYSIVHFGKYYAPRVLQPKEPDLAAELKGHPRSIRNQYGYVVDSADLKHTWPLPFDAGSVGID